MKQELLEDILPSKRSKAIRIDTIALQQIVDTVMAGVLVMQIKQGVPRREGQSSIYEIKTCTLILVSWLRGGSKENCVYISHAAQVTRQVSLLGLIE